MMWGGDINGWEWLWMTLMMFPGVLLIIALVLLVARGWSVPAQFSRESEPPEEILRKRFAAGDINEEEFHRRRETLRSGS